MVTAGFASCISVGARKLDVVMRQEHKPGEKAFIDWAGSTIPIYDRGTEIAWQASLFVASLGASSYTWAEATHDQQMEAWLGAHIHAFDYWGGVTPSPFTSIGPKVIRRIWSGHRRAWSSGHKRSAPTRRN